MQILRQITTYIHGIPARFYTSGEIRLITTHVNGKRLISDEEVQEIIDTAWNRYQNGLKMTHDPVIAKLQEVIRELHNMDVMAASAAPLQPAVNPLPPLPHQPQPAPTVNPANWMAQYQADTLLWATALQHGVVTQHPDSNEYRHGNYNWPDRQKAIDGQHGTLTRPGGTPGNQPRAI